MYMRYVRCYWAMGCCNYKGFNYSAGCAVQSNGNNTSNGRGVASKPRTSVREHTDRRYRTPSVSELGHTDALTIAELRFTIEQQRQCEATASGIAVSTNWCQAQFRFIVHILGKASHAGFG